MIKLKFSGEKYIEARVLVCGTLENGINILVERHPEGRYELTVIDQRPCANGEPGVECLELGHLVFADTSAMSETV